MTRTAPREEGELENNMRAWNPRVYLFKWHNSFRWTSTNQLISEPFSSPVKTPTLSLDTWRSNLQGISSAVDFVQDSPQRVTSPL